LRFEGDGRLVAAGSAALWREAVGELSKSCKALTVSARLFGDTKGNSMSKNLDRRKEGKKKPAKTLDEKRAAKREKREAARR
jgi:hypothetical protein